MRTVETVIPMMGLHDRFNFFVCCQDIGFEYGSYGWIFTSYATLVTDDFSQQGRKAAKLVNAPTSGETLIFNSDQQLIGEVSSGGFGPSINKPVAMGYIAFDKIKSNEQFYAKVRGKQIAIALVSYNFIKALKNQSELK